MIIGMDFGTTNSGAAVFDGKQSHLLPLDPANTNPGVCRTAIYMTRTGDYLLGSEALTHYFADNVGRPTRFRKVWVGEIEQVFAELPRFFRDVYVYEDEFSPGRLFLSIKTALRNQHYYGTVYGEDWYGPSDLAAVFMLYARQQMEKHLDRPVPEIVLGRPVHFSTDSAEDTIAQSRLLQAAFRAGFERVYLEYEPVAAALAYERELTSQETVLVFDFGGGTLDFTIMEIGDPRRRRILATGGVPIAGDIFDQRLFRLSIPRHLGEGDYFVSNDRRYPIPAHIFESLSQPEEVLGLNTPQNLEMLRRIHQGAEQPSKTEILLKVVSNNYALMMFDLVEKAKRRLSRKAETYLAVETTEFEIVERVTRARFEAAIARDYEQIRAELLATLSRSGLRPQQVDRVIRTGGSSQIPLFVGLLEHVFGAHKMRAIDTYSSVTSGLAILGHEIAAGATDLRVYTRASLGPDGAITREHNPEVRPVNLEVVSERLQTASAYQRGEADLPDRILFLLNENHLFALAAPETGNPEKESLVDLPAQADGVKALLAGCNDHLLLVTDAFKLIAARAEALYVAQQAGRTSLNAALPLENGETPIAFCRWDPEALDGRSLILLTNLGQARAFDARLLGEQLAHKPYFQLERRYSGLPSGLFLAGEDHLVIAGTDQGRVGCTPLQTLRIQPYEVLKARKTEWVSAGGVLSKNEPCLGLSGRGEWLGIDPRDLPSGGPPASRGRTIRRNFAFVQFLPFASRPGQSIPALVSSGRLVTLALPVKDDLAPGKLQAALRLPGHERLIAVQ